MFCCPALQNCSTICLPCFASFSTASSLPSGPPQLQHNMSTMFCKLHHCIQFAVWPSTTAAQHVSCISVAATLAMDCSTAPRQLRSCDVHQQCFEQCCLYNGSKAFAIWYHCYRRCRGLMQSICIMSPLLQKVLWADAH